MVVKCISVIRNNLKRMDEWTWMSGCIEGTNGYNPDMFKCKEANTDIQTKPRMRETNKSTIDAQSLLQEDVR